MASKTINTKISLRYDTLANWKATGTAPTTDSSGAYVAGTGTASQYVPLKGEVCIAEISTDVLNNTTTERKPTMLKVGDGKTTFSALDWLSAKAADVYSWARKSESEFVAWAKTKNVAFTNVANTFTTSQTVNGTVYVKDISKSYTVTTIDGGKILVQGLNDAGTVAITNITNQEVITGAVAADTITATNTIAATGSITTKSGITADGNITGKKLITSGGTSSQFVKGDGSLDNNTYVITNTGITGATHTKITYDAKGLVTGGADLQASDIPSLDASKITSGTFADARIASADTWNGKQDKLVAGNNITISIDNIISADNTTYSLATGDEPGQLKLTASNGNSTNAAVNGLGGAAYKGAETSNITSGSDNNVPTSLAVVNYVADKVAAISAIAYVIDSSSSSGVNNKFNKATSSTASGDQQVTISFTPPSATTTILTVSGETITLVDSTGDVKIKIGDVIYTKDAKIKDWFLGSVTAATYNTKTSTWTAGKLVFYPIDSDSPDLTNYITTSRKVSTGVGLYGGGTLDQDITITHNGYSVVNAAAQKIGRDSTGHVVVGDAITASDVGALPSDTTYLKSANVKEQTLTITDSSNNTYSLTNTDTNYYPQRSYTSGLQIATGTGSTDCQLYVPFATSNQYGVVKLGSDTVQTAAAGTPSVTANRTYPIQKNSSGQLVVNVPWQANTWRPINVDGASWLDVSSSKTLNVTSNNNNIVITTASNTSTGTLKFDVGANVLTTEDTLILNGGTATTVI